MPATGRRDSEDCSPLFIAIIRGRLRIYIFECLNPVNEIVQAVSDCRVGETILRGEFLQAAAGLDEADHKRLFVGEQPGEQRQFERTFHPSCALFTLEPLYAQNVLTTGAESWYFF